MSHDPIQYRPVTTVTDPVPATVPACDCGTALYDGQCFNVGVCPDADRTATPRDRMPASAVRAWTVSGRVD